MGGGVTMKLPIRISNDSREPIYHQIENQFKALIAGGHLSAGSQLPSIRALSKDLKISVITTRRAYQNLEQQGYIKTSQGRGSFVADVDTSLKEEIRESTVTKAMEEAIVTARRHDYTFDQTEKIFNQILKKIKRGE